MIAVLSKTTADDTMPVVLELVEPSLYSGERRVAISQTLDQSAAFSDMGFSGSDRRYKLKAIVSEATSATLKTLLENNNELTLSIWDGLFKVQPLRLNINGTGLMIFNCAIKEKLSA